MEGNLEWLKFRDDWFDVLLALSKPEMDRLLTAIREFTNGREVPEMTGRECFPWILMKAELEKDKTSRQKASEAHKEAGAKGGRPKTAKTNLDNKETKKTNLVINENNENQNNQFGAVKELRVKEIKNTEVKSLESVNCADAQKPSKPKPQKHEHGSFKNVLLTDAELEKLHERFSDADKRIEDFSVKKAAKGYVYKSDYAAILTWAGNDGKKQQHVIPAEPKRTYTFSEVYEMQQRGEL